MTWCLGCGGPPTATVAGVVTLDGKPLSTGTVAFYPRDKGMPASGSIGVDGRFSLATADGETLAPGDYAATVVSLSAIPSETMTSREAAKLFITPPRYNDPTTSGLEFSILSGENDLNVNLATTPP